MLMICVVLRKRCRREIKVFSTGDLSLDKGNTFKVLIAQP